MPILSLIVTLVVIGFVMWLINVYVPMAQPIKSIVNIVVALFVVIWLLQIFGVIAGPY